MTRLHALLQCTNSKLRAAREQAREQKDPNNIGVLLGNPRWEERFLRFLELSGVGREVDDGTDEDEARAARLD
jgi:hypothetical protein